MNQMPILKRLFVVAALAALAAMSASCGDVSRQGRSPVYLVIDSLQGRRGAATPGPLSGTVVSDVITNVTSPPPCSSGSPCPTVFNDSGQVVLRTSLKDIGSAANPTVPTSNNEVTITRYRVSYRRADGRNIPGVDVPYGFEGAATGTIPTGGTLTLTFELVRSLAKEESPLLELKVSAVVITAIADVTFYGRDQVGNDITTTGSILIEFGNFGDS